MRVTTAKIKVLNPCEDRLRVYMEHHRKFSGTMTEFLNLPHITDDDKCWVYIRLLPANLLPQVVADIAESVLHLFESAYPEDNRPRLAIEAARSGVGCGEADDAADSAAYPASQDRPKMSMSAYAAHNAACNAAHNAARCASYAARCAYYDLDDKRSRRYAYETTLSARRATDNASEQRALQIKIMKRHLKKRVKK